MMKDFIAKGIELLHEIEGEGRPADKGSKVTYNARFFLRRGDEVAYDKLSIAAYGEQLRTRLIDGVELIDHVTTLGKRQPIAGVEKTLLGMRTGGYREVMVSPHLAYGAAGLGDSIPPGAMLRIQLWLQAVQPVV